MTQDPYQLDDHSLDMSLEIDSDGEYDGLDFPENGAKSSRRKTGMIVVLMLLVLAGGAFATFELFLNTDDSFQPMTMVPPLPDDTAAMNNDMPVDETAPAYPQDGVLGGVENADAIPSDATADAMIDNQIPEMNESAEMPVDDATDPIATTEAEAIEGVSETPDAIPQDDTAQIPSEEPVAADTTPAAIPAPSVNQLTPIDPSIGPAEEQIESAAAQEAQPIVQSDAASKIDAINDILGEELVPQEKPTAAQSDAASKIAAVNDILQGETMPAAKLTENYVAQTEVTPRAKQAIVVTRNYSAQSPQAVVVAGDRVLQAGEYTAAAKIYESQLQKNPSDPIALAGKAQALQRSGQAEQAMDTYQRLIDLNPRDIEALTNYLGLLQQHEPQEALNRLKMLEQQYPENAAVAGQIGMVHARMMDTPNALRYLNKAYALDPVNPTYPFNTAILYDRLGTTDKARDYYRMALDLTRNYPDRGSAVPIEVIRQRLGSIGN